MTLNNLKSKERTYSIWGIDSFSEREINALSLIKNTSLTLFSFKKLLKPELVDEMVEKQILIETGEATKDTIFRDSEKLYCIKDFDWYNLEILQIAIIAAIEREFGGIN